MTDNTPARPADGVPEEPEGMFTLRCAATWGPTPNWAGGVLNYISDIRAHADALRSALVESERDLAEALSAVRDAENDIDTSRSWSDWRKKHAATIERANMRKPT